MDVPVMPATPAVRVSPSQHRAEGLTVGKLAANRQVPTPPPTWPDAGFEVSFAKLVDVLSDRFDVIQTTQNEVNHSLLRAVTKACQAPPAAPTPVMTPTAVTAGRSAPPTAAGLMVNSAAPADSPPSNPARKYYAVARGWKTGIFISWKRVLASITDYRGAKYKRFRSRPPAELWLAEQMPKSPASSFSDDDEDTVLWDAGGDTPRPLGPVSDDRVYPDTAIVPKSKVDLIDFRMAGPDKSVGQAQVMNGVSINISSAVRDLLCPKGTTAEIQNRLIEVTPDVLTCPGKNPLQKGGTEFEVESMWNRFAEAMADVADVQAQKIGAQTRDTQWNLPSRNAIERIKSVESAHEVAEDLASQRDSMLEYTKNAYMEILFAAGWAMEDAEIYCEQGGLIMLVTQTYDGYYSLVQHLISKAYKTPDRWNEFGQPRADFHARSLSLIRRFSPRREYMLYHNFTYVRDARHNGFQDIKLLSKLTENLQAHVFMQDSVPDSKKKPTADERKK
jgi:hypothetical protein